MTAHSIAGGALAAVALFMFATIARSAPKGSEPADAFPVNLILNSSFEMVADSTTDPPKLGAYWEGAFVPHECDPTCRVVSQGEGNHVLRLRAGEPAVDQILTLLGPHSVEFVVELRVHLATTDSRLALRFESEGGRELVFLIGPSLPGSNAITVTPRGRDAAGFDFARIAIGREFEALAGEPPPAWARLSLFAASGEVDVDDVVGVHFLPRVSHAELKKMLQDDVRDVLAVYLESTEAAQQTDGSRGKGLGLVDPQTGYQTVKGYDVVTGETLGKEAVVGITGIHEVMLRYARIPRGAEAATDPLLLTVRETLQHFALSLLKNNVYAPTGLYCLYDTNKKAPFTAAELSPSHFITTVLGISDLFPDDKSLASYSHFYTERMADTMVRLRREHDLPQKVAFGRGPGGNWFGRMPEKISPAGVLAPPKQKTYDQSWAIAFDRSWYHDFDTAVGLMRVFEENKKPEYLDAIRIACAKFDRAFDATRYDLENDTDDHYGRNAETALEAYRYSDGAAPELLDFVQRATDVRLERGVPFDATTWVQGIRLGSFTTGDQPRAYRGPVGLYTLPPGLNPVTSNYEPYAETLRELAKADLRRRLLDDGCFSEASTWQWHMVAQCFKGNYIGPCSEGKQWEGDMGDFFAGPPANGFRALLRTIEIDRPGRDSEWIAWYAAVHAQVLEKYRVKYGYRFGMSRETGERYGIPAKYLSGFDDKNPYGLATVLLHTELLETGCLDRAPARVTIESVKRSASDPKSVQIAIAGPAGREIAVFSTPDARFEDSGKNDWRLRHVSRSAPFKQSRATLDATGHATVSITADSASLAVDVELPFPDGADLEDLSGGVYSIAP